jgi:hypothetical protein
MSGGGDFVNGGNYKLKNGNKRIKREKRINKDRLFWPAESSYSLYARIILMADVLTVLRCIWLLAVAAALLPLYLGSPPVTQITDQCCVSGSESGSGSTYFWSPGSGSISQRYGFGSGSFYLQAKIIRKTLIPTAW